MKHIRLFESWHEGRDVKGRVDYDKIKIDWSKFLKDIEYTFDIIKQLNPNLETQWQQPHAEYLTLKEGGKLDKYSDIESIEQYENDYIKRPIKDYIELYNKVKKEGHIDVTRVLSIDDKDNIEFNKIGKYWSFCENPAQQFDNNYKKHYVKLIGKARFDSIDWLNSLDNYVYYWEDECEITLREGTTILIEKIVDYDRVPSKYKSGGKTSYNFTGKRSNKVLNKRAKI